MLGSPTSIALDIVSLGFIFIFAYLGKNSSVFIQINNLLSGVVSLIITKIIIYELVVLVHPIVGLTDYTATIVYFGSLIILFFLAKIFFRAIIHQFESLEKNPNIHKYIGFMIGAINGFFLLAISFSIIFSVFKIKNYKEETIENTLFFKYVHTIKNDLIDHEK